jgi:hypothetical protein
MGLFKNGIKGCFLLCGGVILVGIAASVGVKIWEATLSPEEREQIEAEREAEQIEAKREAEQIEAKREAERTGSEGAGQRGARYVGASDDIAASSRLLERSQMEGWCISTADCRDGYVCGLPVKVMLTSTWEQKTQGFNWEDKSNVIKVCSSEVCLSSAKKGLRGALGRADDMPQLDIRSIRIRSVDL